MQQIVKNFIKLKYNVNNDIVWQFEKVDSYENDCKCPHCRYNYEVFVLFWKTEGSNLKCFKILIMFDEEDLCIYKNQENPTKINATDFPKWSTISNDTMISSGFLSMMTKKWAKKEQTDESWDKNRQVY